MHATVLLLLMSAAPAPDAGPAHNTLTEREKADGWKLLFDGKSLDGWLVRPSYINKPVKWEAVDGVIRGTGGAGYLCTPDSYADFEMSVQVRIWDARADGKGRGNSGIKIRCTAPRPYPAEFYPLCYEVQVDNGDKRNGTGSVYDVLPAGPPGTKDREWIALRFRAVGNRITVWVDGRQVVDGEDPKARHSAGFVALQTHHETNVVEFRDVKIRVLPAK